MLFPRLGPLRLVPRQPGNRTPNRASDTILNSPPQILHLALRFLRLALPILPNALLLQALGANEAANRFFGRAGILVPRTSRAVGRVGCDATGGCGGYGAQFGGRVGYVVFGVCGGFAVLALGLVGCAAGEGTDGTLDCASGRVDVRLQSRSLVLVAHGCDFGVGRRTLAF